MSALPTTPSTSTPNSLASATGLSSTPSMDSRPSTATNHAVRDFFAQPVLASFAAGGVAGAVSRTVVSPLERLKILLQVQTGARSDYKMSIPKALAKIWREEGMKGMMAGNGTNCIRIVPYSAVQFGSYNIYKGIVSA